MATNTSINNISITATTQSFSNNATTNSDVAKLQLPHLDCWHRALEQAKDLLPDVADITNASNLDPLPIFALIVVAQTNALPDTPVKTGNTPTTGALDDHIKEWADNQPSWRVIPVATADSFNTDAQLIEPLTDVQVYRYVLLPAQSESITAEKKTAAAHILDEQLTAHLRQFIETLPITEDMGGDAAIDCHIVSVAQMLRPHRLACFDMDSTLIQQEVIVEMAKVAGIGEQVNEITESAMRGEINFDESFIQRVALLQGLSTDVLEDVFQSLSLSTGARTTIATLKALGYHTVLLSGGFTYFAERIAQLLGIDEVHSNILDIVEGEVSGNVNLPIVNAERKAQLVQKIATHHHISESEIVCVGDGANDLLMMEHADLGVAYHAKPIVRARADAAINATGLEGVLYILGYDTTVFSAATASATS
ncbi:phosphoserine phosphatase SerB [Psychrobacter sp. I-STPA6b]|uniref:phosphoserine phosphatase SerB n=1 Tax=Psychrobacter sp. I-STPA6b TaxID=2585718 RepID=UPI001D0C2524|nr:phosphoserine phosphatase SerB [Psychrobacter sp. I-STPA6b]